MKTNRQNLLHTWFYTSPFQFPIRDETELFTSTFYALSCLILDLETFNRSDKFSASYRVRVQITVAALVMVKVIMKLM